MDEVKIQEREPNWVLARDGGLWLVGDLDALGNLSPVYELHVQVQQQGQGMSVNYGAQPLLLIASLDAWTLSAAHNSWPVKGLTVEKHIMSAIERAEGMATAMRAAQAGISVAREMPRANGALVMR